MSRLYSVVMRPLKKCLLKHYNIKKQKLPTSYRKMPFSFSKHKIFRISYQKRHKLPRNMKASFRDDFHIRHATIDDGTF